MLTSQGQHHVQESRSEAAELSDSGTNHWASFTEGQRVSAVASGNQGHAGGTTTGGGIEQYGIDSGGRS
jgi:hypothetical protein